MEKREKAQKTILTHVVWSVGAGFVPIPLLDLAAVTAIQLDMLKQIATIYEVDFSHSEGKVWVSALTGSVLARIGANALKLIPGIGTLLGGVSMAVMSGGSTYAMGQVAITHFESGGTFARIDLDWAKKIYEDEYEKGKRVATKAAENRKGSQEVFEKLEKLGQLREKGVITEEDFDTQKKKLLDML